MSLMSDQSNSEDKNKREVVVDPNLGDWSPDYFPVSAKPIFRRTLYLVLAVAFLCGGVAYCSREAAEDTSSETSPDTKDKATTISDNDDAELF